MSLLAFLRRVRGPSQTELAHVLTQRSRSYLGPRAEASPFDHSRTARRLMAERLDIPGQDRDGVQQQLGVLFFGDWSWKPCQLDPGRVWSADEVAVLNREK